MERYKLGELIDVTRGASLPGDNYATEGELIRLTLGNFDYKSNGFKENTSKEDIYYNGEVDDEYILEKGDIITPLTEQAIGLLGSTAKVPESGKYIQSQDVALVKVKSDKLVHDFAYYLLPTASVKKQLSAGAQQTSIRHTSPDKIKDCTVYLPEPKDQQKIADFLNQIEDKIVLNRKENATLEAMAKQLYDYWFVQFDFPDANGRPYKSSGGKMVWNETLKREIPEGWEVKNLFKAVNVLYGFPFATECFTDSITDKPLIRIRDILEGTTSAYTTENVDAKYLLKEKDIVVGMDGNFHINVWHNNTTYINQRCVRFRVLPHSTIPSAMIYFYLQPFLKAKEATVIGSTVGHLSDADLKAFFIPIPDKNLCTPFDELFDKISANRRENIQLNEYRDFCLPLLMSCQSII